jgi:hypothetical protein
MLDFGVGFLFRAVKSWACTAKSSAMVPPWPAGRPLHPPALIRRHRRPSRFPDSLSVAAGQAPPQPRSVITRQESATVASAEASTHVVVVRAAGIQLLSPGERRADRTAREDVTHGAGGSRCLRSDLDGARWSAKRPHSSAVLGYRGRQHLGQRHLKDGARLILTMSFRVYSAPGSASQ